MSCLVRIFAHGGITTAHVSPAAGRYSSDSVGLLLQPYIAREAITADTGAALSTADALTTNNAVKMFIVQIQPGKIVAIEVNPAGRSVAADSSSPRYSGDVTFVAGPGWKLSVLEIA